MPTYRVYVTAEILVEADDEEQARLLAEQGDFDLEMISAAMVEEENLEE